MVTTSNFFDKTNPKNFSAKAKQLNSKNIKSAWIQNLQYLLDERKQFCRVNQFFDKLLRNSNIELGSKLQRISKKQ